CTPSCSHKFARRKAMAYSTPEFERARAQREREHAEMLAQQKAEAERRVAENAAAKGRWQAHLDEQKAERIARELEAQDIELAPQKERARVRFLAANLDASETDFETKAWPRIKASLLQEAEDAKLAATR